jgi:hypothetical protein
MNKEDVDDSGGKRARTALEQHKKAVRERDE